MSLTLAESLAESQKCKSWNNLPQKPRSDMCAISIYTTGWLEFRTLVYVSKINFFLISIKDKNNITEQTNHPFRNKINSALWVFPLLLKNMRTVLSIRLPPHTVNFKNKITSEQ